MKYEYKTVDTSSLKGLKEAERMHANGWRIVRSGLFTILFERQTESKPKPVTRPKGAL